MRITDVECILLRGDETYGTRSSETDATDQGDWLALIRVETDEGLVGWSEVETLTTAAPSIVQGVSMGPPGFHTLRDILVGEDPEDTERLWNKMFVGTAYYGRRGIALHCMSAVDNCLWSIKAQAAAAPLSELLGGRRRGALPAYASSLFGDDPEDTTGPPASSSKPATGRPSSVGVPSARTPVAMSRSSPRYGRRWDPAGISWSTPAGTASDGPTA